MLSLLANSHPARRELFQVRSLSLSWADYEIGRLCKSESRWNYKEICTRDLKACSDSLSRFLASNISKLGTKLGTTKVQLGADSAAVRSVRNSAIAVFLRKSKILSKRAKQCIAEEPPLRHQMKKLSVAIKNLARRPH